MAAIDTGEPTFEDLKLLTQVSQLLTLLDLDRVMQQVIELMSSAVGASKASLLLQNEHDVDWNHIFLMRDLDRRQSFSVVRTVLHEGLAGWVLQHKQGTVVYDTETDSRWHVFPDDDNAVRSVLCVPFIYDDRALAVLTLVHPEPQHFTEHHLHLMQIIANQAAVALHNAQLFDKVQAQQRQLEVVLQAIPDVLIVLNQDGEILLLNDSAVQLMAGQSQNALIGRTLSGLISVNDALVPVKRLLDRAAPDTNNWMFEVRSSQSEQDFLVTVSRWADPRTDSAGFVVIMHDVTTLRDLHRFKDEMLRVVSHDLRNPVSLIITAQDMLEHDMPPLEPDSIIPQYMSIMKQATQRMETMLDDLLREEGSSRQNIDMVELIETTVTDLKPLSNQKKQTVVVEINPDSLPMLLGDPILIREAVENYISNAIKYTGVGGHIVVRAYTESGRFHFEVADNGIGISPADIPNVFEPYFRTEQAAVENEDGYGIGLNLVKKIVERHKGEVMVSSEEGVGSRFGFWLPM
ncbi:MAG: GAF domain-containing protein [Anaerolineae bacterium]|nr:GAF domain-containing protein [Anaerolineae bacterium]